MGKHRLSVFENRVLSRMFGCEGAEMTWTWRKLDDEELHNVLFTRYY
jgi:hypothetical protein